MLCKSLCSSEHWRVDSSAISVGYPASRMASEVAFEGDLIRSFVGSFAPVRALALTPYNVTHSLTHSHRMNLGGSSGTDGGLVGSGRYTGRTKNERTNERRRSPSLTGRRWGLYSSSSLASEAYACGRGHRTEFRRLTGGTSTLTGPTLPSPG